MRELQLPYNSSTGQVPLLEHEISQGTPRVQGTRVCGLTHESMNKCKYISVCVSGREYLCVCVCVCVCACVCVFVRIDV